MNAVIFTTLAAVLVILSLAIHEAAHAVAMMKRGIRIEKAGLGIPLRHLTLTLHFKLLPFPVLLSPLLLGAYVMPAPNESGRIDEMPMREQAAIYGAGIVANLLFGLGLIMLVMMINLASTQNFLWYLFKLFVVAVFTATIWFERHFFERWIAPVLGVAQLIFIVWTVFGTSITDAGMVGPIGLAQLTYSLTFSSALLVAAIISLALGLTNMLPLMPLDGGRIVNGMLPGGASRQLFQRVSPLLILAFVSYAVVSDVIKLLK